MAGTVSFLSQSPRQGEAGSAMLTQRITAVPLFGAERTLRGSDSSRPLHSERELRDCRQPGQGAKVVRTREDTLLVSDVSDATVQSYGGRPAVSCLVVPRPAVVDVMLRCCPLTWRLPRCSPSAPLWTPCLHTHPRANDHQHLPLQELAGVDRVRTTYLLHRRPAPAWPP